MEVTVTIPTLNEENYLPRCLEDLEKNIERFDDDVEVIIVDSYSKDSTVQIAEQSDVVDRLVYAEKGILKARDKGIREAANSIVVCMDADTKYGEHYLEKIVAPMEDRDVSIAYGPAKGENGLHIDSFIRFILQKTLPLAGLAWVNGSNRVIRKEDYLELGGYSLSRDGKSVLEVMWEEQFIFPRKLAKKNDIEYVRDAKSFQSHRTVNQMLLLERKKGGKSWNFINHYHFADRIKSVLR